MGVPSELIAEPYPCVNPSRQLTRARGGAVSVADGGGAGGGADSGCDTSNVVAFGTPITTPRRSRQ